MAAGKRFKFNQGSMVRIGTGTGLAKTITGVSQENPAVIDAVGHGFALGTVARVAGVVGMTELNNQLVLVDNPDTDDFEAANIDATGYAAYVSGGTLTPITYSNFCELTGINQQDGTADEIEVTTICSTAKEFETGLGDSGTLTLDFNFAPLEGVQQALIAAKKAGAVIPIQVDVGRNGAGGRVTLFGSVQQNSFTGSNGGVWTGSSTIRLTGEIYVQEAVAP